MNILFLCNEYPPFISGGIGIFTKELSLELSKAGHRIFVVGVYPSTKNIEIEEHNNVTIIRIKKKKGILGEVLNRFRIYKKIKEIIKKEKIDIIETQDFNGPLAFYPKFNNVKTIVRLHGSVSYFHHLKNLSSSNNVKGLKETVWKVIEQSSFKRANNILSVSNFTSAITKNIFDINKRIVTIYNGINITQNYKKRECFNQIRKFVFAGSIIEKKGIIELIDAWIKFDKNHRNIQLDIYGKDTENLVREIQLTLKQNNCNSVKIHSPVTKNELLEIYKHVDFCIYPSKAEAFSLAPMEAMSMSKVVLYTNQTSASELINESNGFLIKECNSDEIHKNLIKAISLPLSEYNEISYFAFKTIDEHFNLDILIKNNINYYKSAIGKK